MNLFASLFGSAEPVPTREDDLEQSEREAILELLLFAFYADNHLSLAEGDLIKEEGDRFNWQGSVTVEQFVESATERVRRHKSDPRLADECLRDLSAALVRPTAKSTALGLVERLFEADGSNARENEFRAKLSNLLA